MTQSINWSCSHSDDGISGISLITFRRGEGGMIKIMSLLSHLSRSTTKYYIKVNKYWHTITMEHKRLFCWHTRHKYSCHYLVDIVISSFKRNCQYWILEKIILYMYIDFHVIRKTESIIVSLHTLMIISGLIKQCHST